MIPGSEIVLLTDAISHDSLLEDEIITKAQEMQVCISFYLSPYDPSEPYSFPWEPYTRISEETGGVIVESIDRHAFSAFDDEHDYGQCARFYDLPTDPPIIGRRKKRAAVMNTYDNAQRCHHFNTSLFTTALKVQGFTSQTAMIVTTPNSEEVRVIDNFRSEKLYRDTDPLAGQWSVCVETGTLTISLDITDNIPSIFKFIKPVGNSFSFHTSLSPPACKHRH